MRRSLAIVIALILATVVLFAADGYKDIELHPDYNHNRFGITPMDLPSESSGPEDRELRMATTTW